MFVDMCVVSPRVYRKMRELSVGCPKIFYAGQILCNNNICK